MQVYGIDAIVRITSHLIFVYISYWALQSVKLDNVFKSHHYTQLKVVLVLLSVVLGYTVSSFFWEMTVLIRNISYMFFS